MKKLLLIKPPYNFFPMGLAYVMATLRHHQIPYDFVDLLFPTHDWQQRLAQDDYFAVASGGLIGDRHDIIKIIKEVRAIAPAIPFIIGGNITFDLPRHLLFKLLPADYAVIGEAEETFPELLAHIQEPLTDITTIPGLAFPDHKRNTISTPPRRRINLDHLDLYPVWDDLQMDHYLATGVGGFPGFRAMPVLTGRGCTGKCTFCSPTNGSFRKRPLANLIAEITSLNQKYDFTGFAFITEIFYPTSKQIREFLAAYRQTGINKPWVCLLRVDVDESILKNMKELGCCGISFGVESGSNHILSSLRKRTTVDTITTFYRSTQQADIPAFGSFMLGSEGETEKEMAKTIDLLIKEDIAGPCGMVTTYPGTQIYQHAVNRGQITDEFAYINNLDFSALLLSGNFRNVGYLNISAIPEQKFYPAIFRQFRRYTSNLYRRMEAIDLDLTELTACCPHCQTRLPIFFQANTILGMEDFCPHCFRTVHFNFYQLSDFHDHHRLLRHKLHQSKRIAVIGTGINARLLHLYDPFTIPEEHIICHLDLEGEWQKSFFFNSPVISSLPQLAKFNPDLLLIADGYIPRQTSKLLAAHGFKDRQIMPIMPPNWLSFLKKLCDTVPASRLTSLLEHGMNMALPKEGTPSFAEMAQAIATEIINLGDKQRPKCAMIPAGPFALSLCDEMEKQLEITAFLDNFKAKKHQKIADHPLYLPRHIAKINYDYVIVATPSYKTQKILQEQLVAQCGVAQEHIFLFSDLFLHHELND